MSDIVTPQQRSKMMAKIRGKDTRPEIKIRQLLFSHGLRFRLHRRDLPGTPDIVMKGIKVAIFVHGCFWHQHVGCKLAARPSSNTDFWNRKLEANTQRDAQALVELAASGWRTLIIWECATRKRCSDEVLYDAIRDWINGSDSVGEIPPSGGMVLPGNHIGSPVA
ncbi:very short patch repair endonuclease [Castellaniella sp.]|uniref:very short patch repair endonuclease n=1 Tax=Castellaniella sp. TaxID=1955812 RepID=UPI003C76C54C